MSRSNEAFGAQRGGARWRNTSGSLRCPMCGDRTGFCQVARDGRTVLCKRVRSARSKINALGVEQNTHHLHGVPGGVGVERAPLASAAREPADVRHAFYSELLARCPLAPADRENLLARGLDAEAIRLGGYGSLPGPGRAALARAVIETQSEDRARGVPGFVLREGEHGRYWTLSGYAGLLVPCRDVDGRIVALKVRRAGEGDGPRYSYLTSANHGGPSAEPSAHVPAWTAAPCDEVRVTEGELKADVASRLDPLACVSVPGVGLWSRALPVLEALGARSVRVAFDSDAAEKPAVARALRDLVHALYRARYRVTVETWPAQFKGIDDFLTHRAGGAKP